jgi:hypothetical protein
MKTEDLALDELDIGHCRDQQPSGLAGRLDDEVATAQHPVDDPVVEVHVVDAGQRHVTALASHHP